MAQVSIWIHMLRRFCTPCCSLLRTTRTCAQTATLPPLIDGAPLLLGVSQDFTHLNRGYNACSPLSVLINAWFRFFEKLTIDSITVHLTFLPSHERHKRGNSTLLHVAVATGLSMSDLDDIRISLAGFRLSNKLTDPDHLLELISGHFVRQVCCFQRTVSHGTMHPLEHAFHGNGKSCSVITLRLQYLPGIVVEC